MLGFFFFERLTMLIAVYVMIGFLVASLVIKFGNLDLDGDAGDVVAFLFLGAIWPLLIALALLIVPLKLLYIWVQLLQD